MKVEHRGRDQWSLFIVPKHKCKHCWANVKCKGNVVLYRGYTGCDRLVKSSLINFSAFLPLFCHDKFLVSQSSYSFSLVSLKWLAAFHWIAYHMQIVVKSLLMINV